MSDRTAADRIRELEQTIARLQKINAALMQRVEDDMDQRGDAFGLFRTATLLEDKVQERTRELKDAMARLEDSNRQLKVAKEAAEQAARSKDEFLASVSHELRTPLNAILGNSELLLKQTHGPLGAKQALQVRRIDESGRHLLELINDVLDLAKIEAGELAFSMDTVSVTKLCEASQRFVASQAAKKGLLLDLQIDPRAIAFRSDGRRLKQVLVNLLSNAVKFTQPGGSVRLSVALDTEQQHVRFEVSDTGIGIRQEDLDRLFEPFVQVESGLARRYEGTGLGLSLVRHMTTGLGGVVEAHSELGSGSCFAVVLPWASDLLVGALGGEPARSERPDVEPTNLAGGTTDISGARPRILVAEDNVVNREVVIDMLDVLGFDVDLACDGREAVATVDPTRHGLVLMDVQMPEMDGYEATKAIRALGGACAELPIVALTANARTIDKDRSMAAGMNDHLAKPVDLTQLRDIVTRWYAVGVAVVSP